MNKINRDILYLLIPIFLLFLLSFYTWKKDFKISRQVNYPTEWQDNGLFQKYYNDAYQKLQTMSIDEKIAQMLLVRLPEENPEKLLETYPFGGYLLFQKDFANLTKEEVIAKIKNLEANSKIPLLIAVDEEGGKVNRVSTNPNLRETPFLSSKNLYNEGGLERIKEDTIEKSNLLEELGINVNLAPVVDVSTNEEDYMYNRSLGYNTEITSEFASTVISASKNTKVSYTLKHFPGYGNNVDTHTNSSVDNRTLESLKEIDLPPFESGIKAGAEAILVSHNIVSAIDKENPASLSTSIHDLLRNDLNFTGIIMTDNLDMTGANVDNAVIKAIQAGNDLLIVTDYEQSIKTIKDALLENIIPEEKINQAVFRILSWKYYKNLID